MNVIKTTIARLDAALVIEGVHTAKEWCEDEGCYEWDEVTFQFKDATKPVSGKALAWMLAHGGAEWLKSNGFTFAFDSATFNDTRKYIVFVDHNDEISFHRYSDYLLWKW